MTREMTVIGVPCSAGAHHGGLERGPAALRAAGLLDRLRQVGWEVSDAGDLAPQVFTADTAHPRARNRDAVVQACRDVASATARAIAAGQIPVLLGGDRSITAGAVAGCLAQRPDTGLLYLDGDADLRTPQTTIAGNFDGMVIAALPGEGDPGYTGLAGTVPMLAPQRLAILGYDDSDIDPRERHLLDPPVSHADSQQVATDPIGAAAAARHQVEASASAIVVHFDVDAVDSADLPLANYPHHGKGLAFDTAMTVLSQLCASPAFTGLVLTEVNPTHDPDGEVLGRYIDGAAALTNPGASLITGQVTAVCPVAGVVRNAANSLPLCSAIFRHRTSSPARQITQNCALHRPQHYAPVSRAERRLGERSPCLPCNSA